MNARKRLHTMGYVFDINRLPAWKASAFVLIDSTMDEARAEKKGPKKGIPRGRN